MSLYHVLCVRESCVMFPCVMFYACHVLCVRVPCVMCLCTTCYVSGSEVLCSHVSCAMCPCVLCYVFGLQRAAGLRGSGERLACAPPPRRSREGYLKSAISPPQRITFAPPQKSRRLFWFTVFLVVSRYAPPPSPPTFPLFLVRSLLPFVTTSNPFLFLYLG